MICDYLNKITDIWSYKIWNFCKQNLLLKPFTFQILKSKSLSTLMTQPKKTAKLPKPITFQVRTNLLPLIFRYIYTENSSIRSSRKSNHVVRCPLSIYEEYIYIDVGMRWFVARLRYRQYLGVCHASRVNIWYIWYEGLSCVLKFCCSVICTSYFWWWWWWWLWSRHPYVWWEASDKGNHTLMVIRDASWMSSHNK